MLPTNVRGWAGGLSPVVVTVSVTSIGNGNAVLEGIEDHLLESLDGCGRTRRILQAGSAGWRTIAATVRQDNRRNTVTAVNAICLASHAQVFSSR